MNHLDYSCDCSEQNIYWIGVVRLANRLVPQLIRFSVFGVTE